MFIRLLHNKFILPHFKLPTYFMVVLFRHANVILKHILLILIFWLYLALSKYKYYKPISHKRSIQILIEELSKCYSLTSNQYKQQELLSLVELLSK